MVIVAIYQEPPPWAAIWEIMACHLIDLNKAPGVLPVVIGEIIRRLPAKCVLLITGATTIDFCGNLTLCYVLGSRIEGDLHINLEKYSKDQCLPAANHALLPGVAARAKVMRGSGREEEY